MVTGVDDGTIRVFRVADGEEVGRTAQPGQPVGTVVFSPDGNRILATFAEGDDIRDRVLVYDWPRLGDQPLEIVDEQANEEAYFAPSGRQVLTMGNDGVARMWSLAHPAKPTQRFTNESGFNDLRAAFSADGRRVVVTDYDITATVWDLGRPQNPSMTLRQSPGPNWDVSFSPDGTKIATASEDGTVTIWDARVSGAPLATVRLQGGAVYAVRFSKDGSHLLTGGADGTVYWYACDACRADRPAPCPRRASGDPRADLR